MAAGRVGFPPHLNKAIDFCCDGRGYGCGHHIDAHGYGTSCAVPHCECGVWRDHVACGHRDVVDEQAIERRALNAAGRWLLVWLDRDEPGVRFGIGYLDAVRDIAGRLAAAQRPEEIAP